MESYYCWELEHLEKLQQDVQNFSENNQFDEARSIVIQSVQKAENLFSKNHPALTPYLEMLARIYELEGLNSKSEAIYQRILKIWENTFVPPWGIKSMLSGDIHNKSSLKTKKCPLSIPDTITITEDLYLGAGDTRRCYAFPNDPGKCIKIEKPGKEGLHNRPKHRLKRKIMPWLADFSSNREESRFYHTMVRQLGENFYTHAPKCYGIVFTNLGPGLVFERIRDFDGNYSERLDKFLGKYPEKTDKVMLLLAKLYNYLNENALSIFCWNYENLVLRKNIHEDNLVVIDWKSQGNPNTDSPLVYLSSRFKKRKMQIQFINLLLALPPNYKRN